MIAGESWEELPHPASMPNPETDSSAAAQLEAAVADVKWRVRTPIKLVFSDLCCSRAGACRTQLTQAGPCVLLYETVLSWRPGDAANRCVQAELVV